jgi:arsenate reductase
MMRVKEAEYKEQNLKGADEKTLIEAMVNTPKLIERPIVSNGEKAVIGRPPENALALC